MFDPRSYRELCGELTASAEKIQEVIDMKEQNRPVRRRRPVRVLTAVAAVCAALAITAGAANLETIQNFLISTMNSIQVSGESAEGSFTSLRLPEVSLEDREGRSILTVDGTETDITESLAEEGSYTCRRDLGDSSYEVTVDDQGAVTVTGLDEEGETLFQLSYEAREAGGAVYEVAGVETAGSAVTTTVTGKN